MPWKKLGSGSFNTTYVNADRTQILKIPKESYETDMPQRAVRVWNEINAHIKPAAYAVRSKKHGLGWICPYIQGRQSTDEEMVGALIDIFTRTGRIVIDAAGIKNFLTTKSGHVVCVDVGLSLELEKRNEVSIGKKTRRNSIASQNYWYEAEAGHDNWFRRASFVFPRTVETVKALLFIKNNRPDIFDARFLKNKPNLIKALAAGYDAQRNVGVNSRVELAAEIIDYRASISTHPSGRLPAISVKTKDRLSEAVNKAKNILLVERELSLDNLKESCIRELTRYLLSRGSLKEGEFSASLITRFFRNSELTATKAEYTKLLMHNIHNAESVEEIKALAGKAFDNQLLTASAHSVSLAVRLAQCSAMCDVVKEQSAGLQRQASL
ncbi:hypothetical protein [Legionella sp. 16cNR16C]|uniref:hypothetical protein n=1 Tax=Legionella sp. 16cNR16C TaxID=2905656 RepID=UPI001E48D0ED|nr:hypothetical protein [Legionella sp. 16cNR16C]MCE3044404.1 hypothetical protein [Legionella sp. 16cNR16C]